MVGEAAFGDLLELSRRRAADLSELSQAPSRNLRVVACHKRLPPA
jgi:hypothetical protein